MKEGQGIDKVRIEQEKLDGITLTGDTKDLYVRYGQAAARLRAAGAAYEQAKSDYQALLAQFTASAEKHVTG